LGPSPDDIELTPGAKPKAPTAIQADPYLEQFLQVMKPRKKDAPSWANDPTDGIDPAASASLGHLVTSAAPDSEAVAEEIISNERDDNISDLDWMRRHIPKGVEPGEKVADHVEVGCHPLLVFFDTQFFAQIVRS
jgi:hypothetical protein